MPVEVWTARISTRDPDAFNVTRKSGDPIFAPSWPLLRTALERRRSGRSATDDEWKSYARTYLAEMSMSHKEHPAAWEALLSRPRVVLICYCANSERCHRKLLGLVLERLGAVYRGELPSPGATEDDGAQRGIFQRAMDLGDD